MLAVIFRATLTSVDDASYVETADRMRTLALDQYGCREFTAVTEGNQEIAISYWDRAEQIAAWRADPQHQAAQQMGRSRWYSQYHVEVVEIVRSYGSNSDDNTTPGRLPHQ